MRTALGVGRLVTFVALGGATVTLPQEVEVSKADGVGPPVLDAMDLHPSGRRDGDGDSRVQR